MGRVFPQISLHTAATGEQRPNFHTFPDVDAAGALRTQKALVTGETENINVRFLYINIKNTGRLRRSNL